MKKYATLKEVSTWNVWAVCYTDLYESPATHPTRADMRKPYSDLCL